MTPSDRSPPDHAGRVCGIGLVGTELRIRPGPTIGGSAESCGNASAFNAVEILPCADRGPLHMGEHQRKVDDSQESRNHAENSRSAREGAPLRCAIPPLSREEPAPPREPGPVQIPRSGRRGPPGAPSPAPRPSPAEPRSQRPASGRGRRHLDSFMEQDSRPGQHQGVGGGTAPLPRGPGISRRSAAPAPAARGGESGAPPPTGPPCRRRRRGPHCAGWCAPRSR